MVLKLVLSVSNTKDLIRAYFSVKGHLYFDISIFNVGFSVNIICTDINRQINYGSWNGYNSIHENDYDTKLLISEELKRRQLYNPEKISLQQFKRIDNILKTEQL